MGCSNSSPKIDAEKKIRTVETNQSNMSPEKPPTNEVASPRDRGSIKSSKKVGNDFTKIINERCPLIRLDHCGEPRKLAVEGENYSYTLEYCYVSQRGYYPTSLNKPNQDSYLVCENILGDINTNLFGVFDGHGETGDFCSFYAADQFPECFVKECKKNGGLQVTTTDKFNEIYTRSFLNTNFALHSSNIDDSLSGTTGVTIFQHGDYLYCANVGDSRAIIASEIGGEIKSSPLSSDQTPYRQDERERLKKAVSILLELIIIDVILL
jgi:hypothetical protein